MNRCFNKKQRQAIELSACGVCQICGIQLPTNWHADHVIPYSKGGLTDVTNGQALCPKCNLNKGNKMKSIKLREWQQRALNQCMDEFSNGEKLFLTHATPGGGKTVHGLSVFNASMHTHVIILAPSRVLVTQWQEEAKKLYNVELKSSMIYSAQADFSQYQGIVMTYQALNENSENLRKFCSEHDTLVIADEIHHVADGQAWGDQFRNAFEPATNILALTGTPWASQGKRIAFVTYDQETKFATPDFTYDKTTAIADNVCRATEFTGMKARNLMFSDNETGVLLGPFETIQDAVDNNIPHAYTKALSSLKHFKSLFTEADRTLSDLRETTPDAGGLIVAPSIKAAKEFKDELFMLTGQDYRIVHSKTEKPHNSINEYRKSSERWLISVDMVTEGVDIKRLQVGLFLSTKNTELFLRQVIGRIERRRSSHSETDKSCFFYYTKTPDIDELVAEFEEENERGIALSEEQAIPNNKGNGGGGGGPDDSVSLDDLETELSSLTARGMTFSRAVVRLAIARKRRSGTWLHDVPTYIVCKIIVEEMSHEEDQDATAYQEEDYDAPIEVKSKRLRTIIIRRVNKKLGAHLSRQPTGPEISSAHRKINMRIGIQKTNDDTSIELLERKLEYITNTRASLWL